MDSLFKSRQPFYLFVLPALFSLALYCFLLPADKILTIHEAVLPHTTQMMALNGDLLIPKRTSESPWLENPPLPQWISLAICSLFDSCSKAWASRFASGLAGACIVYFVTLIGNFLFGRFVGLTGGFAMATSYEVFRYSTLAEDEIFLTLISILTMACFIFTVFRKLDVSRPPLRRFFFITQPSVILFLFYFFLGLCNLTKGIGFGPMMVLIPISIYFILNLDRIQFMTIFSIRGICLAFLVGMWWPLYISFTIPGAVDLWLFDVFGRISGDYNEITKPFWYYGPALLQATAPWFIFIPFGIYVTWKKAIAVKLSPERFIWIWAISLPFVLSFFSGKHHHYLLHSLAPWSLLAAIGINRVWNYLYTKQNLRFLIAAFFAGIVTCVYSFAALNHKSVHHNDGVFLRELAAQFPKGPFIVNLEMSDNLKGFQIMFYLPYLHTTGIHNLSFLYRRQLDWDTVYVVTQYSMIDEVAKLGKIIYVLTPSVFEKKSINEKTIALIKLEYGPNVPVYYGPEEEITPMQSMYRQSGPFF